MCVCSYKMRFDDGLDGYMGTVVVGLIADADAGMNANIRR